MAFARDSVARIRGQTGPLKWYEVPLLAYWAEALRRQGRTAEAWKVLNGIPEEERQAISADAKTQFDRVRGLLLAHDGRIAEARKLLEDTLHVFESGPAAHGWRVERLRKELESLGGR